MKRPPGIRLLIVRKNRKYYMFKVSSVFFDELEKYFGDELWLVLECTTAYYLLYRYSYLRISRDFFVSSLIIKNIFIFIYFERFL
jgi:hypothetical protein